MLEHYSEHASVEEAIVSFSLLCRNQDLAVGINHTNEAIQAARAGLIYDRSTWKYSLCSLFTENPEQRQIFERCFDIFWKDRHHGYAPTMTRKGQTNLAKHTKSSLVMAGFQPQSAEESEEAHQTTGANATERLKKTDFSRLNDDDLEKLDELSDLLLRQLNHRLKRKLRNEKKGEIDLRRTIRKNIHNGESFLELAHKNRKKEKYRLILLLDVSGSMDKYSYFLLKFIFSIKSRLQNIEAFVFSTKLVRITDHLHAHELDSTLKDLSIHANNWSGGTKIGDCLKEFNEVYSKRILNGKSITIVLSDGLDAGNPEVLTDELRRIRRRTRKLVWMNPLKGTRDYTPTAKGMKAALPEVDNFVSANTFDGLLQLEDLLSHA